MLKPEVLRELVDRGDGKDRAFADAMIRMAFARASAPEVHDELRALHVELGAASLRSHAPLRAAIAAGTCRGDALRRRFDEVPLLERDHFVEEVLGIAYPPLEQDALGPELVSYSPSGYDEIVHALDVTGLDAGDHFLDVGSGAGKAVLLANLLTGAASSGLECDRSLHELASVASDALGVTGARFRRGDAREVPLEDADVVFMYIPFTGGALAAVMDRLVDRAGRRGGPRRRRFLCAGALDTRRYDALVAAGPPRSWLHVYAWR